MSPQEIYLVVTLASTLLGFFFFPLALRQSRPLVSPYLKVDWKKRALAATIDASISGLCFVLLARTSLILALSVSPLYWLIRDGLRPGQSLGKLLLGLVVIDLEKGQPCPFLRSLRRNIVFVLPGFNAVALLFEARAIHTDQQGMRLGDRLAQTQVVEGKDAKDLAKLLREQFLDNLRLFETSRHGARAPSPHRSRPRLRGSRQNSNSNPIVDSFGHALIVGPELVAAPVDRRSEVQRIWGLDTVFRSQLGGEIEDRSGEPGAAQFAAGEESIELSQKLRSTLTQRPDPALESG